MRLWPFVLAILCVALIDLHAELPPSAYKERQDRAPEELTIKVRNVKTRETKEQKAKVIEVTIEAEVQRVERTATSLAPGMTIKIFYSRREHSEPIAGPSELPVLKEGQIYPAFLSREGYIYAPAAGGYSFATVR